LTVKEKAMKTIRLAHVVVPALLAVAAGAEEHRKLSKAAMPLEVQVVFARYKGETKIGSLPYSLSLNADQGPARVRTGINVPLKYADEEIHGNVVYKSVGTHVDCRATTLGAGQYEVACTFEQSSVYTPESGGAADGEGAALVPPLLRNFSSQASFVLRDGQTAQYTAATDPLSGEVLKIHVTLRDPSASGVPTAGGAREYRLLATNRTTTMETELNEAAASGFAFEGVDAGETQGPGPGGEVVVVVSRDPRAPVVHRHEYRVLGTNRTSTMQKELDEAAAEGFLYRGQTHHDGISGNEVVVIMERDLDRGAGLEEYRLLATRRTSTMAKELAEAGAEGFTLCGVSVGDTAAGSEVVAILGRPRSY
jgi:hypothetical protein